MAEKNPQLAALVQAGYGNDASIQGAQYLDYYRRKYAAQYNSKANQNASGPGYMTAADATRAENEAAVATGQRRAAEATAQGMDLGQAPDLTDRVIQYAADQQRLRQQVGVNRSSSFIQSAAMGQSFGR